MSVLFLSLRSAWLCHVRVSCVCILAVSVVCGLCLSISANLLLHGRELPVLPQLARPVDAPLVQRAHHHVPHVAREEREVSWRRAGEQGSERGNVLGDECVWCVGERGCASRNTTQTYYSHTHNNTTTRQTLRGERVRSRQLCVKCRGDGDAGVAHKAPKQWHKFFEAEVRGVRCPHTSAQTECKLINDDE